MTGTSPSLFLGNCFILKGTWYWAIVLLYADFFFFAVFQNKQYSLEMSLFTSAQLLPARIFLFQMPGLRSTY